LNELWEYTQKVAAEEVKVTPVSFTSIDFEKVRQTVEQIDKALADKPVSKQVNQKVKYTQKKPENET
jgi:hypothetical protein